MAKIWLLAFIAVSTAPVDALTMVSNRTQNELQTRSIGCRSDKVSPLFREKFLGQILPQGLFDETSTTLVYICHGLFTTYFSTLFDKSTMNAILVAYKIEFLQALQIGEYRVRTNYWKANNIEGLYSKQDYDELYSGVSDEFDKGHLNPFAINSFSGDYAKSTFVYTNAVPQYSQWNRGAWKEYEKSIRRYTQLTCGCEHRGTMYLMTGTSKFPFKRNRFGMFQRETNSKRSPYNYVYSKAAHVDVPKALWTAGCCVWKNLNKKMAQSIAVMGNNTPYPGQDETTGMTLEDLEHLLGKNVNFFPNVPACRDNSFIITVNYVDN